MSVYVHRDTLRLGSRSRPASFPGGRSFGCGLFFGIGIQEMTLEEIGEQFGLTRERVRQIKEKALRKLRQKHRRDELQIHIG